MVKAEKKPPNTTIYFAEGLNWSKTTENAKSQRMHKLIESFDETEKGIQTKEINAQVLKSFEQMAKEGIKFVGQYWTLGRYDAVLIIEAKDEKSVLKALMRLGDFASSETLVAVSREEAVRISKQISDAFPTRLYHSRKCTVLMEKDSKISSKMNKGSFTPQYF